MRRWILLLVALLATSVLAVQSTAASDEGSDVLKFETMTGVVAPFTGAANPIRGVNGGGQPWVVDSAHGRLRSDGRLDVEVEGLVLTRTGVNPVAQFRAIVSCLTPAADGTVSTVNLQSVLVDATPEGDARIRDVVDLSKADPCIAPIVFVTSPGNAWFAVTGI